MVSTFTGKTAKKAFVLLTLPLLISGASPFESPRAQAQDTQSSRQHVANAVEHSVLSAADYYRAGDLPNTVAGLNAAKPNLRRGSERERRRWITISAKVARAKGDVASERRYLRDLVEYPASWASGLCMGCHRNPDSPEAVPLLDIRGWWPRDRYVALLKATKTAAEEEADTRTLLSVNPNDRAALLRLSCAQEAQGKKKEAEELLRRLPYLKFEDRAGVEPIDIRQFP